MVEWLHEYCPSVLPHNAMVEAAKTGNVRLLEWLSDRHERAPWLPHMMDAAASTGELKMLGWLHSHLKSIGCTPDAMLAAIQGGHLETVKLLLDMDEYAVMDPMRAICEAIENGHSDIAKFLYGRPQTIQRLYSKLITPIIGISNRPIDAAARGGHLHVVQWLHIHYPAGCSQSAMDYAVQNGSLETVRWLHENRGEGCTNSALSYAASCGHLEIMKWLHENRKEKCTTLTMNLAASNGYLDIVQWLHENRSEGCTYETMDDAAANGHLEVVKWLHENRTEGCTTDAMDCASEHGHLEVVKWLHENRREGCTADAIRLAATSGHFEVLLFLHANRNDGCSQSAMEVGDAAIKHLEIVQWLYNKYPDSLDIDALKSCGSYMPALLNHILELSSTKRRKLCTTTNDPFATTDMGTLSASEFTQKLSLSLLGGLLLRKSMHCMVTTDPKLQYFSSTH